MIPLWILFVILTLSSSSTKSDGIQNNPEPKQSEIVSYQNPNNSLNFWQNVDFKKLDIPQEINDVLSKIQTVRANISIAGSSVHYIFAEPVVPKTDKISVLLLHGQAFSSETWFKLHTIQMLAAFGFYTVAMDLPGYGHSQQTSLKDKSQFLDEFIDSLALQNPVIVCPSMSGSFCLKYLVEHSEKMGGFVPVSPIGIQLLKASKCTAGNNNKTTGKDCSKVASYLKENHHLNLNCIKVPTLVIFGEKDRGKNSAALCQLPNSQGAEIPNGRHPAYLSNPPLWHKLLYNFMNVLHENLKYR